MSAIGHTTPLPLPSDKPQHTPNMLGTCLFTDAHMQGPPKQIRAPNTRIHTTAADDQNLQAEARAVRGEGYAPVATPSLVPGGEESPFMTWGELGATPLRLDEGGGGVRVTEVLERGPRYSMPERNAKELVAER